jgi:SAM-dependent methyltransferase
MSPEFKTQFGLAADEYSVFRPEYPAELFQRILAAVPPDCRGRAMDLGAGTGKSTRALTEYFAEVIAVEPDALMAEKLCASVQKAMVRVGTAEEAQQEPASVDLVTVITALHWMNVPRVIAKVEEWLRPGGILAVSGSEFPRTPDPIRAIIRQEFEHHWDCFRDDRLRRKEFPQSIVRAAAVLRVFEESTIPYALPLTPHEFAGFCRSTSYGNAYGRSLADPEAYWRELESRFRQAWPQERLDVTFSLWLILAKKNSD